MGFSALLYSYPKYNKFNFNKIETHYNIALAMDAYCAFLHEDWVKKHYESYEDYCKGLGIVPLEDNFKEYYSTRFKLDNYGNYKAYTSYGEWCSNGKYVQEILSDIINKDDSLQTDGGYFYLLHEPLIKKIISYLVNELEMNYSLGYFYINNCFKELEDEDGYKVLSCDGIELLNDDNSISRIYTSEDHEQPLGICYKEEDEYNNIIYTLRVFTDILTMFDFENNNLYFSAGW